MRPRPTTSCAWILVAAVAVLVPGSVEAGKRQQQPVDHGGSFAGVAYGLTEQAHDGRFSIPANLKVEVDANSDLLLDFEVRSTDEVAEATPEWTALNRGLELAAELFEERARFNAMEIDLDDPDAVAKLQAEINAMGDKVVELVVDLPSEWGLKPEEVTGILRGEFPGSTGDRRQPYQNLARWLRQQLEKLRDEADAVVRRREQYEVLVQAYHDPLKGQRKWVHVEGYDQLPVGQLQPIPRLGLQLSVAEQKYLNMATRMNEQAAASLREIGTSREQIRNNIRALFTKVKNQAKALASRLEDEISGWVGGLDEIIARLEEQAGAEETTPERRALLESLAEDLGAFVTEYAEIESSIRDVTGLREALTGGQFADVTSALTGTGGVLSRIDTMVQSVGKLEGWGQRLRGVKDTIARLGGDLAAQLRDEIIPATLEQGVASLAADFPETVQAIDLVKDFLTKTASVESAAGTLSEIEDKSIWHSLTNPPDTVIELERVGWVVGERLTIELRFRKKGAEQDDHLVRYRVEAVLTGVHRKIRSNLIFARAEAGDAEAKKWKPNVAALANWHYYKRNPGKGGKFWNWLGPGLGIHLASLDQGTDSVEFGAGPSLVLWDGLLSVGYGYNLSVSENQEYYFLGIDLFDVLNRAKGGRPRTEID